MRTTRYNTWKCFCAPISGVTYNNLILGEFDIRSSIIVFLSLLDVVEFKEQAFIFLDIKKSIWF